MENRLEDGEHHLRYSLIEELKKRSKGLGLKELEQHLDEISDYYINDMSVGATEDVYKEFLRRFKMLDANSQRQYIEELIRIGGFEIQCK